MNRASTSISVDLGLPFVGKIPVATLPLIMLFANLYPDCLCKMSPLQYYDVAKASPLILWPLSATRPPVNAIISFSFQRQYGRDTARTVLSPAVSESF